MTKRTPGPVRRTTPRGCPPRESHDVTRRRKTEAERGPAAATRPVPARTARGKRAARPGAAPAAQEPPGCARPCACGRSAGDQRHPAPATPGAPEVPARRSPVSAPYRGLDHGASGPDRDDRRKRAAEELPAKAVFSATIPKEADTAGGAPRPRARDAYGQMGESRWRTSPQCSLAPKTGGKRARQSWTMSKRCRIWPTWRGKRQPTGPTTRCWSSSSRRTRGSPSSAWTARRIRASSSPTPPARPAPRTGPCSPRNCSATARTTRRTTWTALTLDGTEDGYEDEAVRSGRRAQTAGADGAGRRPGRPGRRRPAVGRAASPPDRS